MKIAYKRMILTTNLKKNPYFKKRIILNLVLLFKDHAYIYVGVCIKGREMMFHLLEKAIIGMALLRILSGSIEIFAAFLFIKYNDIEKALIINSSLALIGPIILLLTTTIGLIGMADKISLAKIMWIFGGVACIIYGVKSN